MGSRKTPAVSVIVPNYNHARFLRQRIGSVLAQTYQDFELILLDDCSTDESREILREYASDPRVRLEFNDVNSGSTFKQWNRGVGLARGKYVWIAESDDYADARLLERLAGVLERDSSIAFAYCRSWCVMEDGRLRGFSDSYLQHRDTRRWASDFCVDGREECQDCLVYFNPVPNASAVVLRRVMYEQAGGADGRLLLCGDWKLWAAMALTGKVAYVSEPLSYFRFHAGSVRSRSELTKAAVLEHLQVSRWVLDRVTVPEAVLRRVCQDKAGMWVPAVMSFGVPLSLKGKILREAWALDPSPICRLGGPAFAVVRLKIRRHWWDLRSFLTRGHNGTQIVL